MSAEVPDKSVERESNIEYLLTAEEREFVETWDEHATQMVQEHGEQDEVLERITREWMALAPVTKRYIGNHRVDDQIGALGRIGLSLGDRQVTHGNLEAARYFYKWARIRYEDDQVPEGLLLADRRVAGLTA
ncbi:MAG: hypothetical protein WD926_01665 [Patescibacteria group bacterium]